MSIVLNKSKHALNIDVNKVLTLIFLFYEMISRFHRRKGAVQPNELDSFFLSNTIRLKIYLTII